ncbi:TSC complex subunit 1b isoform X1 [Carassius gibelio]|uniref:TSC complex subunit 1b isoform X1 n=1 Tax=Carassius gibelio TaxID=101364 RepID=UPI002278928F|nr:TSC complex subunit 1b isoform X1 [Carassius gibelio]
MSREQLNMGDLLPLLETSALRQLDEIKGLINEHLNTDRGSVLLNGLVDYFLETNSSQAVHILSSVREPHDKHLFDKMNECMAKAPCRLPTLTLLGHVVRKQPSWIHKIARSPLLLSLLKCLKTDTDVVVLITGVLVLITLLPMIPQAGKQHLYEFFDIFGRLASWNLRNLGHVPEVYLIHLHASVYSLFHRLYGMYPCNFVSYLRSHYSMKENMDTFEEVVKPMLEHVRIHPELVTGTKDHELDPSRWKKFEIHDIVIECAKVSLDPKEASCEEGYASMPEHFCAHLQQRPADCTASPYGDFHSSFGSSSSTHFSTPRQPVVPPLALSSFSGTQPPYRSPTGTRWQNSSIEFNTTYGFKDSLWSPSSQCGMATPPSSRGMSPNPELSQSASHLPTRLYSTPGGKGTPSSNTPATTSPPPSLSDEFPAVSLSRRTASPPCKDGRPLDHVKPVLVRQEPVRQEPDRELETINHRDGRGENMPMTLTELSVYMKEQEQLRIEKEREDAAITEELLRLTEEKRDLAGLRGFDSPFFSTTETLTGVQEKPLPSSILGSSIRDPHNTISTPDKTEITPGNRGRVSRGTSQEHPWSFQPVFMPIEHPTHSNLHRSSSAPEDEALKYNFCSPSPSKPPPMPYEALFDLALPRAASLFVGRKTSEIVQRVALERIQRGDVGKQGEEGAVEGAVSTSPLEVLDRLVQQGGDAHDKVLKRLPLPSKSADWTHFGGSVPLDELHTLRSQLLLLHNQLLYERYKREQHAVRNRRLLRRIINATALEEQNNAMKDQLNLQSVDILSLRESLQVEQQRYRQLWDDRETVVTSLHSQIRGLQQARDDYYTKNQELQSKLQECHKRIGEMEAELQKANNKVCHTGHLLNQLTAKLSSSESVQQQLSFLNKQLLLLGEAHKLCVQELHQAGPDTGKEVQMLQTSWGKETESLKQNLLLQTQKLDAAQQRVAELESQLAKKEHLIAEQKKFLEDVKAQAKGELQASESRYQAQRQVTLALQTELLQLYSRLETENSSSSASALPAEDATEPHSSTEPSVIVVDGAVKTATKEDRKSPQSPRGNGSTLSPAQPMGSSSPANSVNGNRGTPPPVLVEPPPHRPHSPLGPPGPLVPSDTPLTVGSYPSTKSFLGMRARELFRNKSESQCDEDEAPPPRLTGLSQGLKTELCVEPTVKSTSSSTAAQRFTLITSPKETQPDAQRAKNQDTFGSRCPERPRQQPLRIMDYNESHQEHN